MIVDLGPPEGDHAITNGIPPSRRVRGSCVIAIQGITTEDMLVL